VDFSICAKKAEKNSAESGRPILSSSIPIRDSSSPYGSGSLLVREGEHLRRAHTVSAEYMEDHPTPEGEFSAADYSPELSRSYRGLRVWLPLKLFGVEAFRENLAEKLPLAEWLRQRLRQKPGFECPAAPDLSVVPFRFRPRSGEIDAFNRRLFKNIVRSQKLFLSSTLLQGRFVLRACILSSRTHQAEVEEGCDVIVSEAKKLNAE
jgi:aromatic-L-amino-acid/L-tryptophan decarboxylase